MTPAHLSRLAEFYGLAPRALSERGVRYALVLVADEGTAGLVLGVASNISAAALSQVFAEAGASVDRNLERIAAGGDCGDVTPKGPAS